MSEHRTVDHGKGPGALSGIKVVEIATLIAGPYCAMLLGDLGADVIKVEHPLYGDPTRDLGTHLTGDIPTLYLAMNRNKKSLGLDVSRAKGRQILMMLLAEADVLVENLRPDMLEKSGLDYDSVRQVNPRIIYCGLTGFGDRGPYRTKAGTDNIFQGIAGVMMVSGQEGDPPVRVGFTPADMAAAQFASLGVVSALFHRERTGQGQKIGLSLMDSLIAFQTARVQEYLSTGRNPARMGRGSPFACPAGFYRTRDGYITLAVYSDKFWRRLCKALSVESLVEDPRFRDNRARVQNQRELQEILDRIFQRRNTAHWREVLDREDIPNGPLNSYTEVFSDPQVQENRLLVEVTHPSIGPMKLLKLPVEFGTTPASVRAHPPELGEHTREILKNLGLSSRRIHGLEKAGVVKQWHPPTRGLPKRRQTS